MSESEDKSGKISSEIDIVIDFLIKMRSEGYRSVELIDKARSCGWVDLNGETLTFVTNKDEPTVLGIEARNKK